MKDTEENRAANNTLNGEKIVREETLDKEIPAPDKSEAAQKNDPPAANTIEVKREEKKPKKSKLPFVILGAVLLVAAVGGLIYWLYSRQYESTDDAFIEGDVVQISPKVSAYVTKVHVTENQQIHKGDLLVELDTKDLEAKLEQARAQLRAAQAQRSSAQATVDLTKKTTEATQTQARSSVQSAQTNVQQTAIAADSKQSLIAEAQGAVRTAEANLAQTKATVPQVQSNLNLAQKEYNRRLTLYENGDVSRQSLDQALTSLQTAQAQLNAAQKQILAAQSKVNEAQAGVTTARDNYRQSLAQIELTKAQVGESAGKLQDAEAAPERVSVSESQVGNAEASIGQAEAAVHQAELELAYTKIYAPEDGYVSRKAVQEGQLVQIGTPLMALAQSNEIWVVANFKETQLELMRVGQEVDIEVDAYPNTEFHGKVQSFQLGTGSRFSLLPTENASGNYVKVVQRIPVKIVFDQESTRNMDDVHLLAPGMSVEPSVKVR
jgi:membrane fusion protein (multidrug efflux system)